MIVSYYHVISADLKETSKNDIYTSTAFDVVIFHELDTDSEEVSSLVFCQEPIFFMINRIRHWIKVKRRSFALKV